LACHLLLNFQYATAISHVSTYFVCCEKRKNYYDEWIESLDRNVRFDVLPQVKKLAVGLGFQKNLGEKLWELKIDEGPGYRVYFVHDGAKVILLLAGSDKKRQSRTIKLARKLIQEIEAQKGN
jgi:putative addiction module killer protein